MLSVPLEQACFGRDGDRDLGKKSCKHKIWQGGGPENCRTSQPAVEHAAGVGFCAGFCAFFEACEGRSLGHPGAPCGSVCKH